ncbi:MAG: hypothetical protein HYV07_01120 [Deltaproteobacteria bacterium]|nr:hypothetical protein [Deltaproteobacteria bacterium]
MGDPRLRLGAKDAGSGPGRGKRDQSKAVEEGIDIVRDAIREFLKKPKAERDSYLAELSLQLEELADNLDGVPNGGAGARRLEATRRIVEILKSV